MFSENEKRRLDFKPGVPVMLADGQDWELRRPVIRRARASDTEFGMRVVARFDKKKDDDYSKLVENREAAMDTENNKQFLAAELAMAEAILLANYDLTPDEVGELLEFGYDVKADPEGAQLREDVMAVAMGNDPKRLAGGDESFPMPAA